MEIFLACVQSGEALDNTTRFVQAIYQEVYGTYPKPLAWYLTARNASGELVGALGLQFGRDQVLPVHQLYHIPDSSFPEGYDALQTVYYSRFTSTVNASSAVSMLWMYSATCYALHHQYRFGLGILKVSVFRHLKSKGVIYRRLVEAELVIDRVAPEDWQYFIRPDIGVYIIELQEKRQALAEYLAGMNCVPIVARDSVLFNSLQWNK